MGANLSSVLDHEPRGKDWLNFYFDKELLYESVRRVNKDPSFKFTYTEPELRAWLREQFSFSDNQMAGALIDLLGFETEEGELKLVVHEMIAASILYNSSYELEDKLSLLLLMFDYSESNEVTLSDVLSLIMTCLKGFCRCEKLEMPVKAEEVSYFLEDLFREFIDDIFED